MKVVLRVVALLALMCVLPGAYAADLTGSWKGAFDINGTSVPVILNLTASGATLTGNVTGLPTSPAEIHDGKIDGESVSFWLNTDYEGQTYKIVYTGKIAGDHIDFSFGTEDGSWGTTMTVKKDATIATPATPAVSATPDAPATPAAAPAAPLPPAVSDVTGAWKGSFDFNGNSMPVTFNLKSSGGVVTGTVEGMGAAPVDIHDGKIDGDSVTFWLNTEYEGQTYALTYKGKLTPGQIDFSFGTADGSWGATVTAKKS